MGAKDGELLMLNILRRLNENRKHYKRELAKEMMRGIPTAMEMTQLYKDVGCKPKVACLSGDPIWPHIFTLIEHIAGKHTEENQ